MKTMKEIKTELKDYHIVAANEYRTKDNRAAISLAFDSEKLEIEHDNCPFDYETFLNDVISTTEATIYNLCRGEPSLHTEEKISDDDLSGDFIFMVDLLR